MKFKIINKYRHIPLLAFLLLLAAGVNAQCTSWGISAKADSSICAASGKITLSFTGTGAGNVTNMLYSLEPLVSGGFSISPNTSSVFENVPPGSYRAMAKGICNSEVVSATVDVTVPGNYVALTGAVAQNKVTLPNCNTGQAYVTVANGRKPYTVVITSAPARYTGRTSFTTMTNFIIDSLWGGTYTVRVTDACGAAASLQTITITEIPQLSAADVAFGMPIRIPNTTTCNQMIFGSPSIYVTSPYVPYFSGGSPLTFSVSYDGMTRTPYRSIGGRDTVTLPAGQTFANAYGKTIMYYFKTPCGDEVAIPYVLPMTIFSNYTEYNCATSFNAGYFPDTLRPVCYPLYVTLKNNSTNVMWYDTMKVPEGQRLIKNLPFGTYTFNATSADGARFRNNYIFTVSAPTTSPYTVGKYTLNGSYGNDGAVYFFFNRVSGQLQAGSTITLVSSPSDYTYSATITGDRPTSWLATMSTNTPARYFYPGNYLFRLTDSCGTYDLPITVTESDVYRYTWDIKTQQTCTGLQVIPGGTSMYNNAEQPVYFRILRGPLGDIGYDRTVVPEGDTLLLPTEGSYRIGISSHPTIVQDYSSGTGANVKYVDFKYQELLVDINNSLGWICPGLPDNSGTIQANAIGGSKAATGVYTYRLAAEGKGATGPYWATNTTGRFSTATSGGAYTLMKDQNYDVRVEDECGGAAVQTLKIIDFETAELAKADKAAYCIGDKITFKIINLPTTAITYAWSGPDHFSSTLQNPVLSPVTPNSGGNYHVVIYSDICMNPIHADVNVTLAPYTLTCYSAVTDTSVNPYTYGLLGNWKVQRSYAYYAARTESSTATATNVRTDGTIKDFVAFWKKGSSGGWQPQYDTSRWIWNNTTTLYNKKGFELENTDPLGRFNAAIYGFDDALTTAVVQNSRYREAAYEGFEDYYFGGATCDTACSGGRSFDFSSYKGDLDSTQQHTGKYSLRIAAGKTAGISAPMLPDSAGVFNLSFNKNANNCVSGGQVLGSIRTSKDAILPVYSPFANKEIVVSVWVKEEKDCKGLSYTDNRVVISVTRSTTPYTVVATPKGAIIDGWQRYEQVVKVPVGGTELIVSLRATGKSTVYFDDLRIHPYNATMRSFVYNPADLRLMAELDENNYATFYEYDDDGTLIRLKQETESGIKTIKETRSALLKD